MKRRNVLSTITVLAAALVATIVWSADNVQRYRVPQDLPLPLYVCGLSHTGTNVNDWVVTAFYYPSDTIPADYDLFNEPVFAPPVGVVTPLVEGFLVFQNGNPAPVPQVMHNAPGAKVEIWFTPVQNFVNGVGPYPPMTWTVNSMKAEGSIVGYADFFSQAWTAGTAIGNNTVVASGRMQDGRSFWLRTVYAPGGFQSTELDPYPYCIVHFGP
jgi:hypothetical protein